MRIILIYLILLLVLTVGGQNDDDADYQTKLKTSVKGVLKTVQNIVKSIEKFSLKMFNTLAVKGSLKAGEKVTMKTSEKLAVKIIEKIASKGTVKFVSKTTGKLVKSLPYIGVAIGFVFGLWRIIDDPEDWQSYALAAGEVSSGLVSIIPGIGTKASTAIDAGLLAFDIKYAKHEQETQETSEEAQDEVNHNSEL